MQAAHELLYLYGGDKPWDSSLWVTSDDRVRGGSSQSHLSVPNPQTARFHGHLDTSTLGGAGFASQYSSPSNGRWDLSSYDEGGIVVVAAVAEGGAAEGNDKRYVLTLKDEVPGRRDDGRERSGVSWEAEFAGGGGGGAGPERMVYLPWSAFRPTYRGRPRPDARPLDLARVERVGLMMRSFFGEQEGDFSIEIHAIAAWRRGKREAEEDDEHEHDLKAALPEKRQSQQRSWMRNLLCGLL